MPVIANISAAKVYQEIHGRPPSNLMFDHCEGIVDPLPVFQTVSCIALGRMITMTQEQEQDKSWFRGAYEVIAAADERALEKTLRSYRRLMNDLEDLGLNRKVRIYRPMLPLVGDKSVVFLARGDVAIAVRFGANERVKAYLSFPLSTAKTDINPFRRKLALGAYLIQRDDRRGVFRCA